MNESEFRTALLRAEELRADRPEYYAGYVRGLRRAYHGDKFGTSEEHALLSSLSDERGLGYAAGLAAAEKPVWVAPSAEQVRDFLRRHGLTQGEAARIAGLSGSNQVRKYTGGRSPRPVSYAIWFCWHAHVLGFEDAVKDAMDGE